LELNIGLKQELMKKLTNFQETIPVFRVKNLSYEEIVKNVKSYASKFIDEDPEEFFKSAVQRPDSSILISLPRDTIMRIFHTSNSMIIKRRMKPLENLIEGNRDKNQLIQAAIAAMKRLELDKTKQSFEQVEFERLWQIKAGGITLEKVVASEILCRIVGTFRRYINKIPVYGKASIFVKLAGGNMVQSVGIDWRQVELNPIDEVKITDPERSAEIIIKNLNSFSPNKTVTLNEYTPESFSLGYFSMPKRSWQNYMQPVYVATFRSTGWTSLNRMIVIHATDDVYEPISRMPIGPTTSNRTRNKPYPNDDS
jgi:hypothetical protein